MKRIASCVLALLLALSCVVPAVAEVASRNPLITPQQTPVLQTPQRYTNILLLGIDLGFQDYRGSGSKFKKTLEACHTDAIMVASINMTTDEVNLISLPRDTVTYVPGVKGIYKLNGAFNCAETLEEGFQRIRSAASWLLGGIQIDHYCAVDFSAMIALGDFIGGVDLNVEMNYTGHSERKYYRGMQHLDGVGITDYVRARTNATVNGHDIGRTGRQRQMMTAIFQKVRANSSLIKKGWDYANSDEINFYTDMSLAKVLNLLNKIKSTDSVGSHVITGKYRTSFDQWNFTFTDQENRIAVIQQVFGVTVPEIPYVSKPYMDWLEDEGLPTVRYIAVAQDVLAHADAIGTLTPEQQTAVDNLKSALDITVQAFDQAADSMSPEHQRTMVSKRRTLYTVGNETAVAIGYPGGTPVWSGSGYWSADRKINEYQFNWQ